MTALDFPLNPSVGQTFGRWQWDGVKWISVGGSGGGGGVAAPVAMFARTDDTTIQTGVWTTLPWNNPEYESGGWVRSPDLAGFVVPEDGFYNVSLGIANGDDNVARIILSIDGANTPGWLYEMTATQCGGASRVVRYTKDQVITPYTYNRGVPTGYALTLSVSKISEGGPPGPQGPPGPAGTPVLPTLLGSVQDTTLHDTGGSDWVSHPRLAMDELPFKAGRTYEFCHSGMYYIDGAAAGIVGIRFMLWDGATWTDPGIRGNLWMPGSGNAVHTSLSAFWTPTVDANLTVYTQHSEGIGGMPTIHCYGNLVFPQRSWVKDIT
jgi:hypothetical protein